VLNESPVYTIQPVVKPVVNPVWQPVKCLYTRCNRLSCIQTFNRLSNPFVKPGCTIGLTTGCIVYTAGCETGCTTRFDNRLNEQPMFVQPGWTNSQCSFNPVCQPVERTGWQPVVSCIGLQTFNRLSNRFDNPFDNRLYRVNGALDFFYQSPRPAVLSTFRPRWVCCLCCFVSSSIAVVVLSLLRLSKQCYRSTCAVENRCRCGRRFSAVLWHDNESVYANSGCVACPLLSVRIIKSCSSVPSAIVTGVEYQNQRRMYKM